MTGCINAKREKERKKSYFYCYFTVFFLSLIQFFFVKKTSLKKIEYLF